MLCPGLFYWQVYEPAVKTDLCCCAVETPEGLIFCDPVRLEAAALEELVSEVAPGGIILTNGNHERHAVALARQFGIEIWAHPGARGEVAATRWMEPGEVLPGGFEAIPLEGFTAGEVALWREGLLVMGDAIIDLPPYGFSILPDKYCDDPKAGRESLKKLLPYPVEILAFAHGLPIVTNPKDRLAAVIA
jgi:hypothetical protein